MRILTRDKQLFNSTDKMSCVTRKWVIKQAFQGMPKKEDFEIIEEQLPPLKDGGKMHASHNVSDSLQLMT